jgi:glutamate dehydrogenase (NADP+)
MPCTAEASELFSKADVIHAPGKAANAGRVAISGLQITQNAMRVRWSRQEVDANVGGFIKLADALVHGGIV